jgi:hypothetical protein
MRLARHGFAPFREPGAAGRMVTFVCPRRRRNEQGLVQQRRSEQGPTQQRRNSWGWREVRRTAGERTREANTACALLRGGRMQARVESPDIRTDEAVPGFSEQPPAMGRIRFRARGCCRRRRSCSCVGPSSSEVAGSPDLELLLLLTALPSMLRRRWTEARRDPPLLSMRKGIYGRRPPFISRSEMQHRWLGIRFDTNVDWYGTLGMRGGWVPMEG